MARVKTVPTPRNSALSAAMRRPQPSLSPTSSTMTIETETTTNSKVPVTRPQAVKVAKSLSTTRVKDVRSSSTSSQKRKSPNEDLTSKSQPEIFGTKVAVRSGRNTSATDQVTNSTGTNDNTEPPSKRQKTVEKLLEPTRRSSRNIKPTTNGHYNDLTEVKKTTNTKPKDAAPAKGKTSIKLNSKLNHDKTKTDTAKTVTNGDSELDSTLVLETSPAPAQSTRAKTRTSQTDVATFTSASAAGNQIDAVDKQGYPDKDMTQRPRRYSYTSNDVVVDGRDAAIKLPGSETSSKWDPTGLPVPQNGVSDPKLLMAPLVDFKHVHPEAQVDATTGLVLDPAMVNTNNITPQPITTPAVGTNVASAQSATQSPDYDDSHASSPSPTSSADEFSTGRRASNSKGQKAKGKSSANKSKSSSSASANNRGKNVANTYPRKQPFKAQIEYPNYPPSDATVPDNYSMWEICQNYPNSLRESTLLAFVQREWSANELCACLKEDVKEVLYARPGKDKTMVYQKRMERIKKDLVAKGEYQNLLNAPKLREDGRPSWVKRGNVRRK